ncbi:small, acid-soluble spore protein 2 [Alicyclobacillus cellulosilyticus]|uniref:Small, acid-soluble spore protein 2 n=1 Tax=Alicyclobacillus cellulosilyticus TaxID=1003997 RepID=A0A917K9G4_9BACL|nr:alpha/beta-type small acid-soluble spore protein [Alicyclobacillus cellulosilyticus]GGJ05231.1 small, acid-soluble spore protein 2 [Alicyclobacillus cellulosilyticus]
MAYGQKNNTLLVPGCHNALDNLKYEIAAEMGLPVHQGSEDYWGHIQARDAGAVGGEITRRLVQLAEQTLAGKQA